MTPLASSLAAFTAAAALLTVTPGLDTALVLRTAAAEGARRALTAGLGICLGCLAWGALVALGLGMLLQASRLAYAMLKYAGAAYLGLRDYQAYKETFAYIARLGLPRPMPTIPLLAGRSARQVSPAPRCHDHGDKGDRNDDPSVMQPARAWPKSPQRQTGAPPFKGHSGSS